MVLDPKIDTRGTFVKTYSEEHLTGLIGSNSWKEEYISVSKKDSLRGMHFQVPPYELEKMVFCVSGSILDVILDLRKSSPTYNKHCSIRVDSNQPAIIYIPKGCAHGFLALEDNTTLFYKVTQPYSKDHDRGILWNSFGFNWQVKNPTISVRDTNFPKLKDFKSPFI